VQSARRWRGLPPVTRVVKLVSNIRGVGDWTRGMSIADLKKALADEKPRAAVVVSARLFKQLYEAAELRPRKHHWGAPSDAACKKVLDTYLQLEKLPMSDQLFYVTWHLIAYEGVRVVKDSDLFLTLCARGPRSFEFV
jgi:hypothetical protein